MQEIEFRFSPQLVARFHPERGILWLHWLPLPRPCYNLAILKDIEAYARFLHDNKAVIPVEGKPYPVDFTVFVSDTPGVFNLGGDLALINHLIQTRDHAGMLAYGKTCVNLVYEQYTGYGQSLTTLSLVQGLCLGGGFEAALSSHAIIAERQSRFGFPEISFNLFPGMGAYSLLVRRVGQRLTEELLSSGKRYTAQEMFELGIVDVLAEEGEGVAALEQWVREHKRKGNGHQGILTARRLAQRLEHSELLSIVEVWAERAMCLSERDQKLIQRLVDRQDHLE